MFYFICIARICKVYKKPMIMFQTFKAKRLFGRTKVYIIVVGTVAIDENERNSVAIAT